MSAVLTRRRPSRARDRDASRTAGRQEPLFTGAGTLAVAAPPVEPERLDPRVEPERVDPPVEPATGSPAAVAGRSLDEAITALWNELLGGETTACPACGTAAMQPRHSAGAGVVGGRCAACETTLA